MKKTANARFIIMRWSTKLPFLPAMRLVIRSSPTKAAVPSLQYIITYST